MLRPGEKSSLHLEMDAGVAREQLSSESLTIERLTRRHGNPASWSGAVSIEA
jgi:hypothetical protein